jgi:repressor LexA
MGIRSTNGDNDHLRALERKGFISRTDMQSRAIKLLDDVSQPERTAEPTSSDLVEVLVMSQIVANMPLFADENVVDRVFVDRTLLHGGRDCFGLRMVGDSMIEAGIDSGTYVFARKQNHADRGDLIIVLCGETALVRYFYPEREYVRFQPANSRLPPTLMRSGDWRSSMIIGRVVGAWRRF